MKIKREDLVRQIEEARDVDDNPPAASKRPRENKENRKKRKKMKESSDTEKSNTTIKADQAATGIKLEFISNLKSLDDVKAFLELETVQRKRDRKSSRTRKLGQDAFKALKRKLVADFNVKLPNKSIKQARKTLREALKVTWSELFLPIVNKIHGPAGGQWRKLMWLLTSRDFNKSSSCEGDYVWRQDDHLNKLEEMVQEDSDVILIFSLFLKDYNKLF